MILVMEGVRRLGACGADGSIFRSHVMILSLLAVKHDFSSTNFLGGSLVLFFNVRTFVIKNFTLLGIILS